MMNKQVPPLEFLWLGLYAFAGFSLELILVMMGTEGLPKGGHTILTGICWGLAAGAIVLFARKKLHIDIFAVKHTPNQQQLIFSIMLIGLITVLTTIGFGGFKPFMEFKSADSNLIQWLLQMIYYLFESALIVLCIVFGQEFFERQFAVNAKLPAGGVFLAITWGVIHLFLQGLSGGLFAIVFALLAGTIYITCKKDIRWSYLFIALAFIL